jgi:MFS family permease
LKPDRLHAAENESGVKRTFYYGWIVVAVSFITMSLVSPIGTLFQLFYQALKDQFHWSHGSLSGIYGAHQFLNGAISPLVGWLLDRYGPRRIMPVGALILGLAMVASSRITTLWELYLTFGVVAAFGVALLQSVPNTTIVSNWFIRNRGAAIGIVISGGGFGQLWLTPTTQWLILHLGWRAAYLALAPLIFIVPATLILLFQYHKPADKGLLPYGETESEKQKAKREVVVIDKEWAATEWTPGRAVRSYRFWAMAVMTFAFSSGFFLISSQLFVLTQEHPAFQVQSIMVAFILGAEGLHKGIAKMCGGLLSDRLGREKTLTISVGLIIAGIFTLGVMQGHPSAWLLYLSILLYGFGYGFSLPSMMAAYADLFQGPRFGSILGTLTLGGLVGAALGTGVGGHLRDMTGSYQTNFLLAVIAFAIAVTMIWSARPSRIRVIRTIAGARRESERQVMVEEATGTD